MKFDETKPFGVICGDPNRRFEQNGLFYDSSKRMIGGELDIADLIIQTDQVDSAEAFLRNILEGRAVSKSAIYKEAENNNQDWDSVKKASEMVKVIKSQRNKQEFWQLPESDR